MNSKKKAGILSAYVFLKLGVKTSTEARIETFRCKARKRCSTLWSIESVAVEEWLKRATYCKPKGTERCENDERERVSNDELKEAGEEHKNSTKEKV